MKKKIIKRSAWLLAAVIAVSALAFGRDVAYGAVGIETGQTCSLTFSLPENGVIAGTAVDGKYVRYYETLNGLLGSGKTLHVSLYQVADVTVSGKYELKSEFGALGGTVSYKVLTEKDGTSRIILPGDPDYDKQEAGAEQEVEGLTSIDALSDHKAAQWEALARTAEAAVEEHSVSPAKAAEISSGSMTIAGLQTGMYLVCVEQVEDTAYFYDFVPFLISLPNNYYSLPDGDPNNDDTWVYDVTVGLKPEQVERFGTLVIEKLLTNFNQLEDVVNRQGTFIFDVRAEKDGELRYSNVVSLTFDGSDTKRATIGPDETRANEPDYYYAKIPAGAVVTVTEVYSGSGYQAVGDAEKTIEIFHADGTEETNQVSFENAYDGHLNNGASVVNRYKTGEWMKQETQQ